MTNLPELMERLEKMVQDKRTSPSWGTTNSEPWLGVLTADLSAVLEALRESTRREGELASTVNFYRNSRFGHQDCRLHPNCDTRCSVCIQVDALATVAPVPEVK